MGEEVEMRVNGGRKGWEREWVVAEWGLSGCWVTGMR